MLHMLSLGIEREPGTLIVAAQAHYVTENISVISPVKLLGWGRAAELGGSPKHIFDTVF